MKIDLVGKKNRGLALCFNEFAGYISVAIVGFVTGYLASSFGLKPYPFYIGIVFAILGFLISLIVVKDTRKYTVLEIKNEESNSSSSSTSLIDNNTNKDKSNLHYKEL